MEVTQYQNKDFGPYMQSPPVNSINQLTNVVDAGLASKSDPKPANAPSKCGWAFDYQGGAGTGRIWATSDNGGTVLMD